MSTQEERVWLAAYNASLSGIRTALGERDSELLHDTCAADAEDAVRQWRTRFPKQKRDPKSGQVRCSATTKKGQPCPHDPTYLHRDGSPWCHVHADRNVCEKMTTAQVQAVVDE